MAKGVRAGVLWDCAGRAIYSSTAAMPVLSVCNSTAMVQLPKARYHSGQPCSKSKYKCSACARLQVLLCVDTRTLMSGTPLTSGGSERVQRSTHTNPVTELEATWTTRMIGNYNRASL